MSTHTPEPWSVGVGVDAKCGRHRAEVRTDNIPLPIASTMFFGITPQEECEANAARIVACVNALADRDPSKLAELIEAARVHSDVDGPDRTWEERKSSLHRLQRALSAFRKEAP